MYKPLQILDGSSKHMTFKVLDNWDETSESKDHSGGRMKLEMDDDKKKR